MVQAIQCNVKRKPAARCVPSGGTKQESPMSKKKARHTPGPWSSASTHVFAPDAKRLVASVCEPAPETPYVKYVEPSLTSDNWEEVSANVALIVAAPDL